MSSKTCKDCKHWEQDYSASRYESKKVAAKLIGFLEIPAEKETTDG